MVQVVITNRPRKFQQMSFTVPIFSEGFGMSVKNKPKFEECTFHKYLAFFYQSKNS